MAKKTQILMDFDSIELVSQSRSRLLSVDDIWQFASVDLLASIPEDDRIERKPSKIHAPELAKWISMWSNTPPVGGLIVVGMSDSGELLGCKALNTKTENRLKQAGTVYCHDVKYEVKRILGKRKDGEHDYALLFRVFYHSRRVVEDSNGDAYYRYGDSKIRLSEDQRRELAADKGQIEYEQEPCSAKWPDDFSMQAIKQFTKSVRKVKRTTTEHSDVSILINHRLGKMVKGDFVPNIACALLFSNDPRYTVPGSLIRFQRIEGERADTGESRNVVRDDFIQGRIPDMIVEADRIIDSQVRTFSRLGTDGKFYRAKEYPQRAWYEAVVNACVHRSYSLKGMNIFIKMYDDRLEVESPGTFPPLVTPDNIYDVHVRRNNFLMEAMFFLDFVKCENEGTKRMRDSMKELELPEPEFSENSKEIGQAMVRVTFRNRLKLRERWIDTDASSVVGSILANDLTQEENRIINFIAEHGQIKTREAERLTGRTWHKAKKILMGLVDQNILLYKSKYSRDPNSHFVLKKRNVFGE